MHVTNSNVYRPPQKTLLLPCRYEVAGKWRARMAMAGFAPCPFSSNVIDGIRSLLKSSYCDKYRFEKVHDGLHFGWGDKTLVFSSAWQ